MDNPYQPPQNEDPGYLGDLPEVGRPTSVTVFGILNIVFGILGLICTPFGLLVLAIPKEQMAKMQPPGAPENLAMNFMMENQTYRTGLVVLAIIGVLLGIILLTSGIGLLKMKSWGRLLSIYYAIAAIVMVFASVTFTYFAYIVPLGELIEKANNPANNGAIASAYLGLGGSILNFTYPILLLIFMNRPIVLDSMRRSEARRQTSDY